MYRQTSHEPIDGIDTLRRRERTRLWYRREPSPTSVLDETAGNESVSADEVDASMTGRRSLGTDRLVRESVSLSANLKKALEVATEEPKTTSADRGTEALTSWRDAPTHCPVLLLSASPLLDARNPGPILGPGKRYRVLSVHDGVAALEVAAVDGQVGAGYCNAVDLTCFEPNIANLRREGGARGRQTARLSLNRLSQRISGVTAALVG